MAFELLRHQVALANESYEGPMLKDEFRAKLALALKQRIPQDAFFPEVEREFLERGGKRADKMWDYEMLSQLCRYWWKEVSFTLEVEADGEDLILVSSGSEYNVKLPSYENTPESLVKGVDDTLMVAHFMLKSRSDDFFRSMENQAPCVKKLYDGTFMGGLYEGASVVSALSQLTAFELEEPNSDEFDRALELNLQGVMATMEVGFLAQKIPDGFLHIAQNPFVTYDIELDGEPKTQIAYHDGIARAMRHYGDVYRHFRDTTDKPEMRDVINAIVMVLTTDLPFVLSPDEVEPFKENYKALALEVFKTWQDEDPNERPSMIEAIRKTVAPKLGSDEVTRFDYQVHYVSLLAENIKAAVEYPEVINTIGCPMRYSGVTPSWYNYLTAPVKTWYDKRVCA